MDKKTTIYQPADIEKKNEIVGKNTVNHQVINEKMLKLLAEAVVQIIIKEAAEADKHDEAPKEKTV